MKKLKPISRAYFSCSCTPWGRASCHQSGEIQWGERTRSPGACQHGGAAWNGVHNGGGDAPAGNRRCTCKIGSFLIVRGLNSDNSMKSPFRWFRLQFGGSFDPKVPVTVCSTLLETFNHFHHNCHHFKGIKNLPLLVERPGTKIAAVGLVLGVDPLV